MMVYNYSEARQNFSTLLNTALKEDVIIARKDGSKFKVVSINTKTAKSPLEDIQGIKTSVTIQDILDAIKEGREERY